MWNGLFLHHSQFCHSLLKSLFRRPEKEIRSIPISLSPGFWGLETTWLFSLWEKCIIAVAFWQSARMTGNSPCLATVFQVCVGSVAACCSVSGPALFDHPSQGNWIVPQCQDATESNQPLFFPKPNSWTLVLQIKGDSGLDRALIDLPLPRALRAKWPSTCKSAEIWSFG